MYMKTPTMLVRDSETPAIADCATLKHWFKAEEVSADTVITCAVTGLTLPVTALTRLSDGFGINVTTNTDIVPSIALTSPAATDDFMLVFAGKLSLLDQFSFGNAISVGADNTIGVIGTVGSNSISDGTNTYTSGNITAATASVVMTADVDSATGLNVYQDSVTTKGADDLVTPDYLGVTLDQKMTVTPDELYTCMLFYFTAGLPADALSSGLWIADQARLGNKVLHPNCRTWA